MPKRTLSQVEDVEIDVALVAYSNDCFRQGVQHHHGSLFLAAVMDRWPSFSHFVSEKTSEVSSMLEGWRQPTPARAQWALPAPVWEGIAAQLTSLNQLHMAASILILLVTHMRPSELLPL